jgi:3,4-dihydroxy 2-butanone 4-phosphate synthase/GTP cyclohydrolase II
MESITEALKFLQQGKMIVVVDDENRENEGDLVCSAQMISSDQINFMTIFGRGLICVALPFDQIDRLGLSLMTRDNDLGDAFGTAFTQSIDAKEGISTGISAHDRALTIRLAVNPLTTSDQLVVPGHMFPLRAKSGGVIERRGHTEAAVDLTRLAGLLPGGVICEILREDGSMMRFAELKMFAQEHGLPFISIQDLVQYRLDHEVKKMCETVLPTEYGQFKQSIYHDVLGNEHVCMVLGDVALEPSPLVRIHSECLTGDVFRSLRCDCGEQLTQSLDLIEQNGSGVIIYLRQEGRGIGLTEKIKAYALQDQGLDTIEANHALGHETDLRKYDVAVKMLQDLGVMSVRLLTNNPNKISYLEQHCINVVRVPLLVDINQYNMRYQESKSIKLGHFIPL